ncbi:hypothetical protein DSO57_1013891 [Entomophthora muscae]|uniref:Uncharacterized protein n=1 Tax=Entomophthora muscae TaxID=34485 RepID=A0ACC2SUR4_9FUNG|nr:hypothetical protein DSO57_1013891 [Entomophthora muscae]
MSVQYSFFQPGCPLQFSVRKVLLTDPFTSLITPWPALRNFSGLKIFFSLKPSFRIDNSSSLETRAQEQKSNPNPGPPWTTHLRFSGIETPQADTKNVGPCSETSQTKEIIAPNGRLITAPNGGTDLATISFMNLKSTPATNQEPTQERGTGLQPGPMTTTLKQDNQVAKSRFLTNERTPRPSDILLPLDPSTQFPWPCLSQYPDEPLMENVNLRSPGLPAPLPAVFCPPGVPFGPILKLDPLTRIQSAIRYNQQGLWIFSTHKLFRGNFNYLPAYNLPMELPVTPKPMPASSPNLPTNHSGKLFGIMYITLTGMIDTMIPAASTWSWVGKSASYLLKLAPLLWWTLPKKNPPKLPLKTTGQLLKTGSLTLGQSLLNLVP